MNRFVVLTFLVCCSYIATAESNSPYAGQESRSIKALSQQQISDLLDGNGLGYAKVAELNGFPGPAHVLELSTELKLSEEQVAQTEELFKAMKAEAKELGADLVEAERQLELVFVSDSVSENKVISSTEKIGVIEGKLRAAHINAHLAQKRILTRHQIQKYNQLRGYGSMSHHNH
ncbi:TPA: Spy/CpxP family protein refolding chaperone [Vibrio parahaemolyticus]|nr:Spy/CpxP family protein refolding chaperone [Vibrio parahaemolyticus]